jgi:hypothetical protein
MSLKELQSFCRTDQYQHELQRTKNNTTDHDYLVRFANLQQYVRLATSLAPMVPDTKVGGGSFPPCTWICLTPRFTWTLAVRAMRGVHRITGL